MKKYVAEFLGTLILTLAVIFSLAGNFPVPTPVIAGIALGFGVYTMGGISGAHFNPAITIGLLTVKKISPKDAGLYVLAQLAGAWAAFLLGLEIVTPASVVADNTEMVAVAELVGAFVFAFGVGAAAHGKVSAGASGLVVGSSLLLGISLAVTAGSNGVLNPAVAFGIGSFSVSYLLGPVIGAVIAMNVYKYLST